MSAADYAIIRERLDHPQVVVHDPCAPTLAEDDPEWPAPEVEALASRGLIVASEERNRLEVLTRLPPRASVRCALEAVVSVLPHAEAVPGEGGLARGVLSLVTAWLTGTSMNTQEFDRAARQIEDAASSDVVEVPYSSTVNCLADAVRELCKRRPDRAGAYNRILDAALIPVVARHPAWWPRCRALLPIKDVTTAEIEWGDIELPPLPLADDLPGDGDMSRHAAHQG
ncbi:MAG: hypothetical protein AB7K09_02485 [Planctomycetota bacterium]